MPLNEPPRENFLRTPLEPRMVTCGKTPTIVT